MKQGERYARAGIDAPQADGHVGGADADGLLLVELQTVTKPLRFSITTADAFQFAEKLVKAAMGAPD